MAKEETTKIKKKRWYPILSPKLFGEKIIGESLLTESKLLMGRIINCNLMSLTNDVKSQNIYIKFIVKEIKDNKAYTEPITYEISPTYIKRLVRRGKGRVDDSYAFKTKDKKLVRVKPFLLTNSRANKSILAKIRKVVKQKAMEIITQNSYEDIFDGVVSHKIQRELREEVNKIFPIRIFEIRVLGEEKEKSGTIKKEEVILEFDKEKEVEEKQEESDEEINEEDSTKEKQDSKIKKRDNKNKKDANETSD